MGGAAMLLRRMTIAEDRVQVAYYALFLARTPEIRKCIFV
jgi:hypothetical protein